MNSKKINRQIDTIINEFKENKFPVFCVTGKMAAGKNFISSFFESKNFLCIDFDKEVHFLIEEKNDEILKTFEKNAEETGLVIKTQEGKVDKRALGVLLFSYPELLEKQEKILYPALSEKIKEVIKQTKAKGNFRGIILNATVLYKIPSLLNKCDLVIFVDASWIKRFNRARKRGGLRELEILQRFTAQKNLLDKYKDFGCTITTVKN